MQHPLFPPSFYQHLKEHTLTGIKAGKQRTSFLNIWMVQVDGRVFARSWGKSERSWFTTLLAEGQGQIQYGDTILNITGIQCTDANLNKKIDQAYIERYSTPNNLTYAIGITQPSYAAYTMELLPAAPWLNADNP